MEDLVIPSFKNFSDPLSEIYYLFMVLEKVILHEIPLKLYVKTVMKTATPSANHRTCSKYSWDQTFCGITDVTTQSFPKSKESYVIFIDTATILHA